MTLAPDTGAPLAEVTTPAIEPFWPKAMVVITNPLVSEPRPEEAVLTLLAHQAATGRLSQHLQRGLDFITRVQVALSRCDLDAHLVKGSRLVQPTQALQRLAAMEVGRRIIGVDFHQRPEFGQ